MLVGMRRQGIRWSAVFCAAIWVGSTAVAGEAAAVTPGASWKKAESPDAVSVSSERLEAARAVLETLPTRCVMVVVDGFVVFEYGDTSEVLPCHSVRKSLLSGLYGIEVERGRLRLGSTLAELGIDDVMPPLSDAEKRATVAHLLTSRSGVFHLAAYESASRAAQRPARGTKEPGEYWVYNNWDFNALGTIYEEATEQSVFEGFEKEFAKPLEMEDFRLEHMKHVLEDSSIHAAYTFKMSARDLARFGLLYLREGKWGDEQIVPKAWVEESTYGHAEAEFGLKYGYMWWVADDGRLFPGMAEGSRVYAARGTGGHTVAVFPERKMVIVHRSDTRLPIRSKHVGSRDLGRLFAAVLGE